MKYITAVLKSKYCELVFLISFLASYFLIPKRDFYGWNQLLAYAFMLVFALTMTCIIRNIKEKILLARTYKSSLLGIIAVALGLAALQVCGANAPVCGAAVGIGILSSIFPAVFINLMAKPSVHIGIILTSIAFQIIALYFMNCWKEMHHRYAWQKTRPDTK